MEGYIVQTNVSIKKKKNTKQNLILFYKWLKN